MESVLLDVRREGAVAHVTLNRPDVRNAFNAELIEELRAAFATLGADRSVRAIVLAGAGSVFCGGADINWMRASLDLDEAANVEDARKLSRMLRTLDRVPQCVIGRIQGAALGGGAGLAACCDVAIAADGAVFGFTETKLGILPAVISPFVIGKIGRSHARALALTGERFDARRALAIGLVHEVVALENLEAAVERVVNEMLGASPTGVAAAKALIARIAQTQYDDTLEPTANAIAAQRVSPEGQEGLRAFLGASLTGVETVSARPIRRLLIANRGEIAVRVARGARTAGIVPLGVYSEADRGALHVSVMDDAVCIGPAPALESYLDAGRILAAAHQLQADAIHPGYGFLSERAAFAQAVADAGLTFVGPSPSAMGALGDKIAAKRLVREHGVPVVPGYDGDDMSVERLRKEAEKIGTPVLVKASAGGGGRGMRVVNDLAEFEEAVEAAKREALSAFGDDRVLLERYLARPRHIELQIMADTHGNTLYVGERECSIQRRHQKIIEEAPSSAVSPELRERMGRAAVDAAKAVGYSNAGTVEFLLDEHGGFYFLEMNARLQVEHPVTEEVYGLDLVALQLKVAAGEALPFTQAEVIPRGWAIEARVYAEEPERGYIPSIGTIRTWDPPLEPGVRVDAGVRSGSEVSIYYDSMLAKIIAWGGDRNAAIERLTEALASTRVSGVNTNIPLLLRIARDPAFRAGDTTTAYLEEHAQLLREADAQLGDVPFLLAIGAAISDRRAWRIGGVGIPVRLKAGSRTVAIVASRETAARDWTLGGDLSGEFSVERSDERIAVRFGGARHSGIARVLAQSVEVDLDGRTISLAFEQPPSLDARAIGRGPASVGKILAPMPGKVAKVLVRAGETVAERALLVVLEAMKMEHRIEAPLAGSVRSVAVAAGALVKAGDELVEIG